MLLKRFGNFAITSLDLLEKMRVLQGYTDIRGDRTEKMLVILCKYIFLFRALDADRPNGSAPQEDGDTKIGLCPNANLSRSQFRAALLDILIDEQRLGSFDNLACETLP